MTQEIIKPGFETVFAEGLPNSYIIGITDQSEELEKEILSFLNGKDLNEKIILENDILKANINDKFYHFDLAEHLGEFLSKVEEDEFFIVFGFFNEDFSPKHPEMKGIKFELNKS